MLRRADPAAGHARGGAASRRRRALPAKTVSPTPTARSFYHLSEGGELFPVDWLLALDVEVPASDGSVHVRPFLDNIERFGLLPDAKHAGNPYGLPVGISLARSKLTGAEMIG